MKGRYKAASFDKDAIKALAESLGKAGVPVSLTWKKNNKRLDDDSKANVADMSVDGRPVLRQMGRTGTVEMDGVTGEQRTAFLLCLKNHGFCSKPNWDLGGPLFVVYWLVLLLVAVSFPPIVGIVVVIGGIATSAALLALFMSATKKIHTAIWWPVVILGVLGYFVTTLYSVLLLPLFTTILTYRLNSQIKIASALSAA